MIFLLALVAFGATVAGTGAMRRYALARRMMDVPNERSSHVVPTPRGGGVAFVAVISFIGAAAATLQSGALEPAWLSWMVGGVIVAAVGALDDRRGVPAGARLFVHGVAAAILVTQTGLPLLTPSGTPINLEWAGLGLAWLALIWSINAFNFMDGTDGIAGAQAVFVFGSAAVLAGMSDSSSAAISVLVTYAAGAAGFLVWNLPRAKIFMGDAGSGFLGFGVAALALISAASGGPSLWVWMVLHALFIADATATLVTRGLLRQRLHVAHRTHVYQRLSRRFNSHGRVLALYSSINALVLLPLAALGVHRPELAPAVAITVLGVAVICAVLLGAGRSDQSKAGVSEGDERASL